VIPTNSRRALARKGAARPGALRRVSAHGLIALAFAMILSALAPRPASALMAGAIPDSPAQRVDGNTAGSPWRGVGSVVVKGMPFSGVLITPNHALTAAHVVGGAAPADVVFVLQPGTAAPVALAAEAITRFPGTTFPYDDLAIVHLRTPAPPGALPYPVRTTPLATGQIVTLVGFGASGNGDAGTSVIGSSSVKRVGGNRIDAIVPALDDSGRTSTFFVYDFDGPSGNGVIGGPTLGNAFETGAAGGDSGSPVFAEIDGATWLVGISTFVASTTAGQPVNYRFGTLGGGMLLSDVRFLDWLRVTTRNTLVTTVPDAEVPAAPWWALGLLAGALATGLRAKRRRGDPH
jgi:hypothetical protein